MEIKDTDLLVAKIGKEEQFQRAMNNMLSVANGKLGWQGQSEMMYELSLHTTLGISEEGKSKEQVIADIKTYLVDSFMSTVYEYGEWVSEEEAKKREIASQILYGK